MNRPKFWRGSEILATAAGLQLSSTPCVIKGWSCVNVGTIQSGFLKLYDAAVYTDVDVAGGQKPNWEIVIPYGPGGSNEGKILIEFKNGLLARLVSGEAPSNTTAVTTPDNFRINLIIGDGA